MPTPWDMGVNTTLKKSLNDLDIGIAAVIKESTDNSLRELGFLPGEYIIVIARASFGGPTAVRVGSSVFAIRPEEAAEIIVD